MKLENNWRQKTIENLEKDYWSFADPEWNTGLVVRCHELRKKSLDSFTIGDLRIMIGQQIGLPYLIPLAVETLKANLLAEGDYYPGDLLNNVLSIDTAFWKNNKSHWDDIYELIKDKRDELRELDIPIPTNKFFNAMD